LAGYITKEKIKMQRKGQKEKTEEKKKKESRKFNQLNH